MLHSIDRQKVILDNLKIGSVTSINHLIQKTKFNESTIRRDLKNLAKIQKVMILRGGVIRISQLDDQSIEIENLVQKQKIAKYAASLIKENDSIIINGGTTCSLIPDFIDKLNIKVLTNSFSVATKLINKSITDVTIPGGRIYQQNSLILSPFNFETIKHFHASKLFLSCISINDVGLLENDENLVKFVTGLISISDEIILLADDSKFYKNKGSFIICPLESIDNVITDKLSSKVQDFQMKYFKTITALD